MYTKSRGFKKLLRSFGYAYSGLSEMVKSEQNVRLHLLVTICVIIAGFLLKITLIEWCLVLICISLVWVVEAFNTAIERLTDHIFKERHQTARMVKDISAGAVLVCAIIAAVCGVIIFLPKLLNLI